MKNKVIFGQYYDADSFIHRLDPRVKIIGLLTLFISLFFVDNIYVLLGVTGLLFILILCTKTPIYKFFKSIRAMSFIMLFTFLMQIFTDQSKPTLCTFDFKLTVLSLCVIVVTLVLWVLFSRYIKMFKTTILFIILILLFVMQYFVNITPLITPYTITISESGFTKGVFLVIRFIDFLFLSSLLTLTTKPTQINNAIDKLLKPLQKLGLNTGAFAMIVSVTLRFIPTLMNEASKILKAQASRGADLDEGNIISKVGQLISLVFPLFIVTYKKSVDLTYAMEARGYVEKKERSSIYPLTYKVGDYIAYGMLFLIIGSMITLTIIF